MNFYKHFKTCQQHAVILAEGKNCELAYQSNYRKSNLVKVSALVKDIVHGL